jgi:glycosyltransferase involved in cell wall biosynthesis
MRVALDHHSPFMLAHGGFQIQIERTLLALRHIGVDADWLRFWDTSSQPDIIHFFGKVSSPYLTYARDKGIKTVVNELLTGLGSHSKLKRLLQRHVIGFSKRFARPLARRMDWDTYQNADALMALTRFEADLMSRVFHAPAEKVHVIPNGVDDVFLENSRKPREEWLMCTAVIHPRKRVLELAQASLMAGIPIRIFGRPYSLHDPYYLNFLRVVESSGGLVRYEGEMTNRAKLADTYRRSRGFVLPSTMESLSLSALEAATTGCPLLLTDLPWAVTTFGDSASYVPNTSDSALLSEELGRFYRSPKPPEGLRVLGWDDVAGRLRTLYESILV